MHLVKFKDGRYGIRRWFFGFRFKDFQSRYWWSLKEGFINGCKTDRDTAIKLFTTLSDVGKKVKI